ncbi:MAG: metabolite traffic protein EboE [Aureliella sp.]
MNHFPFGYCTNVHAGITLAEAQANLERVSMAVRELVAPQGNLPIGLWLAERAARQLAAENDVARFGEWLRERSLRPYTFNGFPQGDFHQAVVKHAVYEPNWLDGARVDYTCLLADILAGLLPEGEGGSISTVPLGWPHRPWREGDYAQAGAQLRRVAKHLAKLAQRTGREIVLAIEPEPGCVLDTATDMIQFLEQHVFQGASARTERRHITVCHDICHSAVMFERQVDVLQAYVDNGIRVGKLQVSSAVEVPWHELVGDLDRQSATLQQLLTFSEPRYLHQTTRAGASPGLCELVDDLPIALRQWLPEATSTASTGNGAAARPAVSRWPTEPWRIHFHVPIYVDRFGGLKATRSDIAEAACYIHARRDARVAERPWFTGHYEVETYAWSVLPAELQTPDLAHGIARELQYFQGVLEGLEQASG